MTSNKPRLPILLWGDAVEHGDPILRRALAGSAAHECMYAWVYLTEFLALKRLATALPTLGIGDRSRIFEDFDKTFWDHTDRRSIDPHFQITKTSFESAAHALALALTLPQEETTVVELGSTFFATALKWDILYKNVANFAFDAPILPPRWIGIDNSRFMHDSSRALHGSRELELVDHHLKLASCGDTAILISRFVASYVFDSAKEFADYCKKSFKAIYIEDAYSTTENDVFVHNHGQSEGFFSLKTILKDFEEDGYSTFLIETYPDWPAGTAPCHVVRYLAIKKSIVDGGYFEKIKQMGFDPKTSLLHSSTVMERLNENVSSEYWKRVKENKHENPVWGPTPHGSSRDPSLMDSIKNKIRAWKSAKAQASGYANYILKGSQALNVIGAELKKRDQHGN